MADVFISYAREDKAWAERLAKAIQLCGFSVWWDRKIAPGMSFDDVIQEALAEARSVIVLWSRSSVRSDFVKDEAQRAADRDILIPVLIQDVRIPLGFGRIQTANLLDWKEAEFHPQFERVVESIAVHAGRHLAYDERTGFRVLPLTEVPPDDAEGGDAIVAEPPRAAERPAQPTVPEPIGRAVRPPRRALHGVLVLLVLIAAFAGLYSYKSSLTDRSAGGPQTAPESEAASGSVVPEGETVADTATDPTPEDLRQEAAERYAELAEQRLDAAFSDADLLARYEEFQAKYEGHLPPERADPLSETLASFRTSAAAFAELRKLEERGRSTIVERLGFWRDFKPARPNGTYASYAKQRIAEIEESVKSFATVASPEDFVTCGAVQDMTPVQVSDQFHLGKVNVFTRIRAPRDEKVAVQWYGDEGSRVETRYFDISRNPAGYRVFDDHLYQKAGRKEVRLYNERGDLIAYQRFEVLTASAAAAAGLTAPPRFTMRAQTVRDSRTGLMWTRRAQGPSKLTWNDAGSACDQLRLAAHDDWRLPSIEELLTLADPRVTAFELRGEIELDAARFGGSETHYLWSADAASSSKYLLLDLENGATVDARARKKQAGGALCVRHFR